MASARKWFRDPRLWALLVLVGGAAVWYWGLRDPTPPAPPPAVAPPDDSLDAPVPTNPGYVGVDACAGCHAKRVEEFKKTRHAVAMVPASADRMPAAFTDGHGSHPSHEPGVRFEMGRNGSDFVATAIRSTPGGEQRVSSPIAYVYGSAGVLDEVYFTWRGDHLFELPVTYLHPQHTWGNVAFSRHLDGDFSRFASYRCLECHNTWFAHVPGTANRYQHDSFITGIGCERCHGPGQEHVAHHTAHPNSPATAVVHPGHLSRDRLMDVCAQCHSNATKPRGPANSYRPGEPLENHYRTAISAHKEEDHVANQTKYLRESKCFQKTDTLTCITCHNPHKPTDHEATQRSCAKCHQPEHCKEQPKLPAGVRNNCVGCHMPPRVWMTVNFHTADDLFVPPIRRSEHRIGIYPEATNAVLLEWERNKADSAITPEAARLTKWLSNYWLAEADERAGEKRYLAAIGAVREAMRVESTPALREKLKGYTTIQAKLLSDLAEAQKLTAEERLSDAMRIYERVLADHPGNAIAHGRLGTLLARNNRMDEAKARWKEVVRCDPNDAYGEGMLGWIAFNEGQEEQAIVHFKRVEEIEPFNAKNRLHWAYALVRLRKIEEAVERFQSVLAVEPVNVDAHKGLKRAYQALGKTAEAEEHERIAERLSGK